MNLAGMKCSKPDLGLTLLAYKNLYSWLFYDNFIFRDLKWCYTGGIARTIFSATQRCNVGTMRTLWLYLKRILRENTINKNGHKAYCKPKSIRTISRNRYSLFILYKSVDIKSGYLHPSQQSTGCTMVSFYYKYFYHQEQFRFSFHV